MLAALRRARDGYLLTLPILLLCAAGRTPTAIAAVLFCSRSSVYRTVCLSRTGQLGFTVEANDQLAAPIRTTVLLPVVRRSLSAWLKAPPRAYGWCRTRWSCATLAAQLTAKHGLAVSAWSVRRGLHERGGVWKRATLVAKDDDPQRVERLARMRWPAEQLQAHERMVFADELAIHLLPKVGAPWQPKGSQEEVMTPGKKEKHYLAGALNLTTGEWRYCLGPRKTNALFRELLSLLDRTYLAPKVSRIYVVVDNYRIPKAQAVEQWLANHPRFVLLWLPTYCPRAKPIERTFGDVHDKCTRNHKCQRLCELLHDVTQHLRYNGPGQYKLSRIEEAPEVAAAVERSAAEYQAQMAA